MIKVYVKFYKELRRSDGVTLLESNETGTGPKVYEREYELPLTLDWKEQLEIELKRILLQHSHIKKICFSVFDED